MPTDIPDAAQVVADDDCRFDEDTLQSKLDGPKDLVILDYMDDTGSYPRPVTMRLRGTLSSPNVLFSDLWKSYSLIVTFHEEDASALLTLHDRVCRLSGDVFEVLPLFKQEGAYDYFLKLKEAKNTKKFQVRTNVPIAPPRKLTSEGMYKGQPFEVTTTVFAWFSKTKSQCGLGLSPQELRFDLSGTPLEGGGGSSSSAVADDASVTGKPSHPSKGGRAKGSLGDSNGVRRWTTKRAGTPGPATHTPLHHD